MTESPAASGDAYEQGYLAMLVQAIGRTKRQADRPMVLFIALRLCLITASAILPALAANHLIYVTYVAVLIAVLTGVDTHFHWGDEWRHFRRTQLALERLKRDFDYRHYALAHGRKVGLVTTDTENLEVLHNGVEDLLLAEADAFFKFRITELKGGEQK